LRWDGAVPEYDAFGREIGEDTLAGLGGSESLSQPRPAPAEGWNEAQVAAAASFEPTPAPPVATPEPAPATFQVPAAPVVRMRRRRGLGCLVGLIVLAAFAAGPLIAVVGIVGSVEDTFDGARDAIEGLPDAVPDIPAPETPAEPPTGIAGRSMIAPGNFGRALARLDGMGGVTLIRLSPDRVDAQLVKGARQRSAQVDFEGELTRSPATPGGAALSTIALSAIDRAAPARLVRGSAARYAVRPRGINYLVLMPWPGEGHRWIAYFKNGTYVQGDRNGRVVRRIS
jgi:hypothetical protein